MPFCTNCGQPTQPANKFCASCGYQLQAPVPAANQSELLTPPPLPSSPADTISQNPVQAYPAETVKFIFPNLRMAKTFGRTDEFTLVMTERRSIFAKITQEILNEAVKEARASAAAGGKGFFGKWGAQMKGFNNYATRYNKITPDKILLETPGNFAIENASIRRIRITNNTDEENSNVEYGIQFQTVSGNLSFKTAYNQENNFKQAYGENIVR